MFPAPHGGWAMATLAPRRGLDDLGVLGVLVTGNDEAEDGGAEDGEGPTD